jgi:hypothetical protein
MFVVLYSESGHAFRGNVNSCQTVRHIENKGNDAFTLRLKNNTGSIRIT